MGKLVSRFATHHQSHHQSGINCDWFACRQLCGT